MKRPRLVLSLHPAGHYVSRTVPASHDGVVGMSVRTHPGTYDTTLVDVTITPLGRVRIDVLSVTGRRPVFTGQISDDGRYVRYVSG